MSEDVRIPFVMNVKSVRILTAEAAAAAEHEAARDTPLGPHDVVLPIKGAENLRFSPGLQEEMDRVQRASDRKRAAEASRAALARNAQRRLVPPGTPPLLRKLYRNMLPSPNDPRPEDFTPEDTTPDNAPDSTSLTAPRGLRARTPRLFRSPQPPAPSTDDDPTQAAPPQDAATPSDASDAAPSPLPQTPAPTTDTTPNATADDDGVALLASIDPLSHVTPASTRGQVRYASNDRVQFDAGDSGDAAGPQIEKVADHQPEAGPNSHPLRHPASKTHPTATTASTAYVPQPGDVELLAKMIFTEADGDEESFVAIGSVALNRVKAHFDGDQTLSDVLFERNQFQGMAKSDPLYKKLAHPKSLAPGNYANWQAISIVAAGLIDGSIADPTGGALYFYSSDQPPSWLLPRLKAGSLVKEDFGVFHFLKPSPA